jgi:beta-galactosidase
LKLSVDRTVVNADGNDLAFITVTIVDRDGHNVPTAGNRVRFSVSGPGRIAATGNGDPTNQQSFQSDRYNAFHGQCLVIVRATEGRGGSIRLTASSEGLAGGNIVVKTRQ